MLLLLCIQLIAGLAPIVVSADHMDDSVMVLLATWAQIIVSFQPDLVPGGRYQAVRQKSAW